MRMLAMNSLMHEAERRRETRTNERSAFTNINDAPSDDDNENDEEDDDDELHELDPVDGFPSPPTRKKGSSSDLNGVTLHENGEHGNMAVLGSVEALNMPAVENEFPMLDSETVDRNRADSSWEVPATKHEVPEPEVHKAAVMELLDVPDAKVHKATVMELIDVYEPQVRKATVIELQDTKAGADKQPVRQAKPEGFMDSIDSTASAGSRISGSSSASAASSISGASSASSDGSTNAGSASLKTLPRLQLRKDLPAAPLAYDAYDEDDNPLCRSFQNVRDVDLIRTQDDEDEEDNHDHGHDESHDDAAAGSDDIPDVNSPDFAGRVRVSSGATSVADFVGGFKGQLSRRSGTSGLVNRKRAVRHARLTAAEQKAAELARRIRESRNRVPLEFRDEYMSLAAQNELHRKRKKRARGRHVRFDMNVQCREFEVESEEEDDGYDSPDEIVDAVQLVSKRDVVHAEDVVAAFPVEELEDLDEAIVCGFEVPSPPSTNAELNVGEQDNPLTFSQLHNDKRLSFSDL
ncbi:hypothetical protein BBO99_00006102 [Phytophthora kernoviae]|uniref:Uncharacterized protein n=1 Tax=Phytophthora kernoviae TaxID=325452 RepID=A0A3R7HVB9_9STRA|nr:hypothetical protein JM16_005822 [Phytophthora kernoviae]RLN05959.1 hypothetical protein BBI17_006184 [Phytophthora kernoviae]RLN78243.1 hypothetical protein BBO99_00006102 [Phytophthora kernoviae]